MTNEPEVDRLHAVKAARAYFCSWQCQAAIRQWEGRACDAGFRPESQQLISPEYDLQKPPLKSKNPFAS